jgi:hypothetical protein
MLVLATLVATVGTTGIAMTSAHAGPSTKQFCDADWKITQVFNSIPDKPTAAQTKRIETKINAVLVSAAASIPPEIAPQVAAAAAALQKGLESASRDPSIQENAKVIDSWVADHCGYQVVDVHATEYDFAGIPKTLEPGRTLFRLTNDGKELHELIVSGIKTKTPLEKLVANEKRAERETDFASATYSVQGDATYAFVDLKKGRYGVVCNVAVGSVDPAQEPHTHHGPSHASQGMATEFKVS